MVRTSRVLPVALVAALLLCLAAPVAAANYPLEITNIKPRSGGGMSPQHRIYRAYPGLEYNIRAAVIGGAYPYTYSLTNAPDGMTVDARGTIVWSNPKANASPTLTVRDAEGTIVSTSWSIEVGTAGFKFVDAVNGRAGASGLADAPWRSFDDVHGSGAPGDIVYFKAGTYSPLTMPRSNPNDPWERVEFRGDFKPVIWLAYPGTRPVIDFGYTPSTRSPMIRIMPGRSQLGAYIDGFETKNSMIMAFQLDGTFTFRNMVMHDLLLGGDGSNAAFIMTLAQPGMVSSGSVIQDSTFYGITPAASAVAIKLYSQEKTLIDGNVFHDVDEAIHIKGDVRRFTVRDNRFHDIGTLAVGGNMHGRTNPPSVNGEILFNNIRSHRYAIDLNQDGVSAEVYVYRNTLVGSVLVRNVDAQDGPFHITQNVIINGDGGSRIQQESVAARGRIVVADNATGSPGDRLVDEAGQLTPKGARHLGTHGHQMGGAAAPPAARPPAR